MRCIPIDQLPKRKSIGKYERLDDFFRSFMKMGVKYAKVAFEKLEYTSATSCRGSLCTFLAKNVGLPIITSVVNGDIYLIRTDMEDTK